MASPADADGNEAFRMPDPSAPLAEAFPHPATAWPWPTFGVNVGAAFLLGYFVTRLTVRPGSAAPPPSAASGAHRDGTRLATRHLRRRG
jgi:hypothetical protein